MGYTPGMGRNGKVEVRKAFALQDWTEGEKGRVIAYWEERGFVFAETAGDTLIARRGSLWGNLTSFNMSKLIADLEITRTRPDAIECVMTVSTFAQGITEWNQAYWKLEMDTMESWLLRGDKREAEWEAFLEANRKATLSGRCRTGGRGARFRGSRA